MGKKIARKGKGSTKGLFTGYVTLANELSKHKESSEFDILLKGNRLTVMRLNGLLDREDKKTWCVPKK